MEIPGQLFDGQSTRAQSARVRFEGDTVTLITDADSRSFPRAQVVVRDRIGNTARVIEFPGLLRFETDRNDLVDKAGAGALGVTHVIHLLESNMRFVALSLLCLVVAAALAYLYALPWAAKKIAYMIPQKAITALSAEVEKILTKDEKGGSKLTSVEQARANAAIGILKSRFPDQKLNVSVRGGFHGANAFALPDGTIILTEELVKMMLDRREIVAVLMHEMGHVHHRHGLQSMVQGMAISLFFLTITGGADWTSLAGFLVANSYSREHEREADLFAAHQLQQVGLSPLLLADGLARLQRQSGASLPAILSSHPLTEERIRYLRQASMGPGGSDMCARGAPSELAGGAGFEDYRSRLDGGKRIETFVFSDHVVRLESEDCLRTRYRIRALKTGNYTSITVDKALLEQAATFLRDLAGAGASIDMSAADKIEAYASGKPKRESEEPLAYAIRDPENHRTLWVRWFKSRTPGTYTLVFDASPL